MQFGVMDYYAMFKKRGIRLPLVYFLQNHLFDLTNGTDTHTWLPKERYSEAPENFEHGVLYMCSWTSVVKKATKFLVRTYGLELADCAFIDIGCGKGKVLCVWSRLFRDQANLSLVGIEYSSELLQICEGNLRAVGAKNYQLLNSDASVTPLRFGRKFNIYYLYNPFDETILSKVIEEMAATDCFVIYNNPQHSNLFIEKGFSIVREEQSWHPIGDIIIFSNRAQQ